MKKRIYSGIFSLIIFCAIIIAWSIFNFLSIEPNNPFEKLVYSKNSSEAFTSKMSEWTSELGDIANLEFPQSNFTISDESTSNAEQNFSKELKLHFDQIVKAGEDLYGSYAEDLEDLIANYNSILEEIPAQTEDAEYPLKALKNRFQKQSELQIQNLGKPLSHVMAYMTSLGDYEGSFKLYFIGLKYYLLKTLESDPLLDFATSATLNSQIANMGYLTVEKILSDPSANKELKRQFIKRITQIIADIPDLKTIMTAEKKQSASVLKMMAQKEASYYDMQSLYYDKWFNKLAVTSSAEAKFNKLVDDFISEAAETTDRSDFSTLLIKHFEAEKKFSNMSFFSSAVMALFSKEELQAKEEFYNRLKYAFKARLTLTEAKLSLYGKLLLAEASLFEPKPQTRHEYETALNSLIANYPDLEKLYRFEIRKTENAILCWAIENIETTEKKAPHKFLFFAILQ
ncbi:MAG: hypothetical protein GX221_11425 [Candidatus Riflebacteria bacterium]|nr:hypothetical protein [Candidatus Riflebacteria bacterium]